jgi:gluconolactonase
MGHFSMEKSLNPGSVLGGNQQLYVIGTPNDYSGGRIERLDPATGEIACITDKADSGFAPRGPNDLVFDHEGGLWFTDMGKRRPRDLDYGGIYWLSPDRKTLREVAYPVLTANGIGLSPDGKVLYVAETEAARLWAFDIVGPGEVKKLGYPSRSGGRLVYAAGMPSQRFDSLAVEENGNICVATLVNGGITVISPEGKLVEFISLPDVAVTNICFGDPDLKIAYITLSNKGRLIKMEWPRPGLPLYFLNR